jgi:hypothetical protein
MEVPEPAVAPVAKVWETVQSKVAPAGVEVREILVAVPEQIVCNAGVANADGIGFTVITTSIGVPGQPVSVGVTV